MTDGEKQDKLEELTKAKDNVRWLLDHEGGLIDMHGLSYWAAHVDYLRAQIKAEL